VRHMHICHVSGCKRRGEAVLTIKYHDMACVCLDRCWDAVLVFDVCTMTSEFFAPAVCCSPHMTMFCACWYVGGGCKHAVLVAPRACCGSSDNCACHLNLHAASCCTHFLHCIRVAGHAAPWQHLGCSSVHWDHRC
jgi:hypothetical protein